jgi:hypothetical protein
LLLVMRDSCPLIAEQDESMSRLRTPTSSSRAFTRAWTSVRLTFNMSTLSAEEAKREEEKPAKDRTVRAHNSSSQ